MFYTESTIRCENQKKKKEGLAGILLLDEFDPAGVLQHEGDDGFCVEILSLVNHQLLFFPFYIFDIQLLRFLLAAILTNFFQVLIDGPTTGVPRQGVALAHVVLTPHVVAKLPRAARSSAVAKKWEASEIDAKWAKSAWAQKIAQRQRRAALSDFERFQVLLLKKQQRLAVNKAATKA